MLTYLTIAIISIIGSFLTFFSGFGLGTLLLPIFTIFFPFEVALIMTAIVHFFNGVFKFIIVGKHVNKTILIQFGITAIIFSLLGSMLFSSQITTPKTVNFELFGYHLEVVVIKMIIGLILFILTIFELLPVKTKLFSRSNFYIGGAVSGFFGGLTGSQGALRSFFLKKANLSPVAFVATGTAISLFIDVTRIPTYISQINTVNKQLEFPPIMIGIVFAFLGAIIGKKYLKKVSIVVIDYIVGCSLIVYSALLILGLV